MWKTTKGTILAKKLAESEYMTTESGIKLAGSGDDIPWRAEVMASGVDGVEVGDVVLYLYQGRKYAAFDFRADALTEEKFVNIPQEGVMAVIGRGEQ